MVLKRFTKVPLVRFSLIYKFLLQDQPSMYWMRTYDPIRVGGLKRQLLTQFVTFFKEVLLPGLLNIIILSLQGQVSLQPSIIYFIEIVKAINTIVIRRCELHIILNINREFRICRIVLLRRGRINMYWGVQV